MTRKMTRRMYLTESNEKISLFAVLVYTTKRTAVTTICIIITSRKKNGKIVELYPCPG